MGNQSRKRIDRRPSESRNYPRARITAPIVCSLTRRGIRGLLRWTGDEGVVLDLSLRGARVLINTRIHPGDRLTLAVRLPHQAAPMRVAVATVRWEQDQTYGIEFTRLSPVAEKRLGMFLTAVGSPPLETA